MKKPDQEKLKKRREYQRIYHRAYRKKILEELKAYRLSTLTTLRK